MTATVVGKETVRTLLDCFYLITKDLLFYFLSKQLMSHYLININNMLITAHDRTIETIMVSEPTD